VVPYWPQCCGGAKGKDLGTRLRLFERSSAYKFMGWRATQARKRKRERKKKKREREKEREKERHQARATSSRGHGPVPA